MLILVLVVVIGLLSIFYLVNTNRVGGILLLTDKDNYCINDTIQYTIVNYADVEISTGEPCVSAKLYIWNNTQWIQVKPVKPIACPLLAHVITPGSSRSFVLDLKNYRVFPGKYKLVVEVTDEYNNQRIILEKIIYIQNCR